MLKKNQQRLKEKRRAKRLAAARAQKKKEQKPERNGFGERTPLSGGAGGTRPTGPAPKPKPKREVRNGVIYIDGKKSGYTSGHSSGSGSSSSGGSSSGGSSSGGSSSGGNSGGSGTRSFSGNNSGTPTRIPARTMPSNPPINYSKPVRRNFSSQAAFLKALETYMRKKKRGEQAARSVKKKTTTVTDGRQYGIR